MLLGRVLGGHKLRKMRPRGSRTGQRGFPRCPRGAPEGLGEGKRRTRGLPGRPRGGQKVPKGDHGAPFGSKTGGFWVKMGPKLVQQLKNLEK